MYNRRLAEGRAEVDDDKDLQHRLADGRERSWLAIGLGKVDSFLGKPHGICTLCFHTSNLELTWDRMTVARLRTYAQEDAGSLVKEADGFLTDPVLLLWIEALDLPVVSVVLPVVSGDFLLVCQRRSVVMAMQQLLRSQVHQPYSAPARNGVASGAGEAVTGADCPKAIEIALREGCYRLLTTAAPIGYGVRVHAVAGGLTGELYGAGAGYFLKAFGNLGWLFLRVRGGVSEQEEKEDKKK